MIHSPLIADPIHITGVYVSPSEGEVEEFFQTLTQQDPTLIVRFTYMQMISTRMLPKNLKLTSLYKNDHPPFHPELATVTDDTHPRHLMHLALQMQEYPPSSGVASYSECSTLRLF